jgi:endonuclease G
MNKKLNIAIIAFIVMAAACTKKEAIRLSPQPINNNPDTIYGMNPVPYSIVEDFEAGIKPGYAAGDVILKTGSWNFNDALIAGTSSDSKTGGWSVRIENSGSITTNFKISGLQVVYVSSGTYGTEGTSSWQLQVSTDGRTFTQVGATINVSSNTLRTDSFQISAGNAVQIRIAKASSGGKRINVDNVIFKGVGSSGISYDTTVAGNDSSYYPDTARYVIAGSDAQPSSGDNSNMLLGNPSNADSSLLMPDNYLLNQHYYVASYSASRGEPNWTSWHLDATNIGSVSRTNNFAAWAGLYSSWYQVMPSDYSGSGFDRGHNCPSADRTSSLNANDATFLMTNMIPQTTQNNETVWNNFENYVRTQVQQNGMEAYIIMGSYGNDAVTSTIDGGRIAVPSNIWKVVVLLPNSNGDLSRIDASTRVIAINTPNTTAVNSNWTTYITTVNDIESATGYTLFTALSPSLQTVLKAKKDTGN